MKDALSAQRAEFVDRERKTKSELGTLSQMLKQSLLNKRSMQRSQEQELDGLGERHTAELQVLMHVVQCLEEEDVRGLEEANAKLQQMLKRKLLMIEARDEKLKGTSCAAQLLKSQHKEEAARLERLHEQQLADLQLQRRLHGLRPRFLSHYPGT